jgi:hypothetical protein
MEPYQACKNCENEDELLNRSDFTDKKELEDEDDKNTHTIRIEVKNREPGEPDYEFNDEERQMLMEWQKKNKGNKEFFDKQKMEANIKKYTIDNKSDGMMIKEDERYNIAE